MNSYLSLTSIRLPDELRREAVRNYLKSGGSNLLQSWPLAGLPTAHSLVPIRIRPQQKRARS